MSVFGSNIPKGITKAEMIYVRGELKSAPFGSAAKLNDHQVDEIMERLTLCLDPDSVAERQQHMGQVDQTEADEIETQAAQDRSLNLSSAQQAHLKAVLQKYVDINKHGGLFGI